MNNATYDFTARRGNSLPIKLRMPNFDGSGSRFVFSCWRPHGEGPDTLRLSTDDDSISASVESEAGEPDAIATVLSLTLSPSQTRWLCEGRVNPYEIERHIDREERTLLSGYVIAEAGVNDDA
jgi:hypothetical protein